MEVGKNASVSRVGRWIVTVSLLAAAIAVTSPVALVVSLWVGSATAAVGVRSGAPTYVVAGVLIAVVAAVTVTLWATVPGVHRRRRRPMIVALLAQAVLLVVLSTPAWPVVAAAWLPRVAVAALLAWAALVILIALARRAEPGDPLPGLAPAVAGLVGAYALVAVVSAVADAGIPQFPRLPWLAAVDVDSAVTPLPVPAETVPPLGLAPGEWSGIHNDAYMTDTYSNTSFSNTSLPNPDQAVVTSFFAGGDCASLVWNRAGQVLAVCVSPTEVRGYILDPATLEPATERRLSGRPLVVDALTNFSGGGYAVLDDQWRLVTPLPGAVIARWDSATLESIDSFNVAAQMAPGEEITSVLPVGPGDERYWFVGRQGTVGILDAVTGQATATLVGASGLVDIENSFALGGVGIAYVVTGEELLKVEARDGEPIVAWRFAYDRGVRKKPGQTSRASGTTPTVFAGGAYVAIADNAEPRMNVVVVDTTGERPRQLCAVPVFSEGESATENSLIAIDGGLIVENNFGYSAFDVAGGRTTTPGVARIDVEPNGCQLAWENGSLSVPSLVSKATAPGGAILTYTKDASVVGTDAWWFTALDVRTGAVAWRRMAGIGPMLNNHYAGGYLGPDGSFYVGTISGVVALVSAAG